MEIKSKHRSVARAPYMLYMPFSDMRTGRGENPLPISDFDAIYERNLGILTLGALVT